MTIASQTSRISYVGDGSTTAFAVPFYFAANTDLVVMLQDSSGVQSTLVLGTDYSLTGAGVSSGGTCTFTVAPTSTTGATISIYRDPPVTQTTSYNNNDPFPAKSHEAALDKLTMLEQRTRDMISRSLVLPDSDPVLSTDLPTKASRANKLLGFDTDGVPTAVLGPSFVGGTDVGAAVISTKAVAQVTTFAGSVLYLIIGGTSAAGDTTQQTYIRGSGTGGFTDGGGVAWKPVPAPANLFVSIGLSALGDGATNDQAAMQATLNTVAAAGGGYVYLATGKDYRVVVNSGVTDWGLIIPSGVTLMLNNASISLECTGDVYGVRLQSNAHILGPGTVATTVSVTPGSSSVFHAPISVGFTTDGAESIAVPGNYASPSNWSIRKLAVNNARHNAVTPDGSFIHIAAGANHGIIEDITIPDNSTVALGVAMDWMPLGAITSADVPGSRTAFNAGTGYTLHPHDIQVRRIAIGNLSAPNTGSFGSHGVRLSGCYKILVEDVTIAGTTFAGLFHTAGDLGFEFAPSAIKNYRYKGTRFKDIRIEAAHNGWGVFCDCYADNVAVAQSGGYSPILPTQGETDIVFENVFTEGSNSSSAWPGFRMQNQRGGMLHNCLARVHSVGVLVETNIDRLRIIGGDFNSNWTYGIYCSSSNAAEDLLIDGAQCYSNGVGGGGSDAGIYLDASFRPVVQNCILGGPGENFQDIGLRISANTVDALIINNYVLAAVATGYSIATSTDYGVLMLFDGNKCASSVTTKYGGANIQPYAYTVTTDGLIIYKARAKSTALSAGVTPTSGTWTLGTIIEYTDPSSGGKIGTVCTSGGSPGTWKSFGIIS